MTEKIKPNETLFLIRLGWYGILGVTNLTPKGEVWHRMGNEVRPLIFNSKYEQALLKIFKIVEGVITHFDPEKQEFNKEQLQLRVEARRRREVEAEIRRERGMWN